MIETINPATGEVIERIALMEAPQIEKKLADAARGALRWAREDFSGRGSLLRAVAARFRLERDRLATTAVREMAKSYSAHKPRRLRPRAAMSRFGRSGYCWQSCHGTFHTGRSFVLPPQR